MNPAENAGGNWTNMQNVAIAHRQYCGFVLAVESLLKKGFIQHAFTALTNCRLRLFSGR